jgi:hypothetical protein
MEADTHGKYEFPEGQLRKKRTTEKFESDEEVGQFPNEECQSGITKLIFESRPKRLVFDTIQSQINISINFLQNVTHRLMKDSCFQWSNLRQDIEAIAWLLLGFIG